MKRIAIFCDGTWNRLDSQYDTHVERMMTAVLPRAADGVEQLRRYLPGVGTGGSGSHVHDTIDRLGGGAFGWGLTAKVEACYRDLVRRYEVGDEIHVFGFSRGAYTARSLVGLIRNCGLPPETQSHRIEEAMAFYKSRKPGDAPWTERAYAFRASLSPSVATSVAEQEWRRAQGLPEGHLLRIAYMGIWDTVGALGVPGFWKYLSRIFNRKYEFHDTDLSRMVLAARHAVAIDEKRQAYPPTLWANLDELNGARGDAEPYRQQWFPGVHGVVGGGVRTLALSAYTALWVAEGAEAQGLAFDPDVLAGLRAARDPLGPLDGDVKTSGLLSGLLRQWEEDRKGPRDPANVSEPARLRWRQAAPPYRPETLGRVADALDTA